jgi:hypothetical protein
VEGIQGDQGGGGFEVKVKKNSLYFCSTCVFHKKNFMKNIRDFNNRVMGHFAAAKERRLDFSNKTTQLSISLFLPLNKLCNIFDHSLIHNLASSRCLSKLKPFLSSIVLEAPFCNNTSIISLPQDKMAARKNEFWKCESRDCHLLSSKVSTRWNLEHPRVVLASRQTLHCLDCWSQRRNARR